MAGKANENFLNADLFVKAFLRPCESVRHSIGLLMFEFSRFWLTDYGRGISDLRFEISKWALGAGWDSAGRIKIKALNGDAVERVLTVAYEAAVIRAASTAA